MKCITSIERYPELDLSFAEFKAAWPLQAWLDEAAAKRAWFNLGPNRATVETILAAVKLQRMSTRWDDPTFIPKPANWLRDRRWTDDPKAYPPDRNAHCPECGMRMRTHLGGECVNVLVRPLSEQERAAVEAYQRRMAAAR